MATPLIRVTFGRITDESIARITIGHININGEEVDTIDPRLGHTGGFAGRNVTRDPNLGVKFIPNRDEYRAQRLREDVELIELVVAMIEGKVI